jgi:hypothetical protein
VRWNMKHVWKFNEKNHITFLLLHCEFPWYCKSIILKYF